jgi:hypothetical protein
VLAFLCAPLPVVAALPDDPGQFTPRVLLFVPFGVLISVLGVEWLVTHRGRAGRIAAALLIFSVPMQFTSFVSDYFTRYQTWAAFRFDDMNLRGVAEYVIGIDRSSRVPALYFVKKDARESKTVQWKFHLLAHGRPDIWNRSTYFVPGRSGLDVQSGSLLIHSAVMEGVNELTAGGRWSVIHMVNGVAGDPAAVILRWH